MHLEPVDEPVEDDRAKTNTKPIPVPLGADGFPELPPTTSNDSYKTKIVQSMLREYCTAHIRAFHLHLYQVVIF